MKVENCPYCNALDRVCSYSGIEDLYFRSHSGTSDFVCCSNCRSLWQECPLAPDALAETYANYYTHETGKDVAKGSQRGWKTGLRQAYLRSRFTTTPSIGDRVGATFYRLVAKELDRLEMRGRFAQSPPARILDYGCGNGEWLAKMVANGYQAFGVDFDPQAAAAAGRLGVSVLSPAAADDAGWEGFFDLVTISHVIEHVRDPVDLLKSFHRWLKPGGMLYIEAPNAEAEGLKVFEKYWRGLEAPRHLTVPSAQGIRLALQAAGFGEARQYLVREAREWLWNKSITVVPDSDRQRVKTKIELAEPENLGNAEYLLLTAFK